MSGIALIILNAALAIAAITGTVAVNRRRAPAPLVLEPPVEAKASRQAADAAGTAATTGGAGALRLANSDFDDLWRMTLFLPSREEPEDASDAQSEAEAAAAALAAQNIEFELIGLARIAQEGAEAQPVAILRNKAVGGRRSPAVNARRNSRIGDNRRNPPARGGGETREPVLPADPTGQNRREVFKVGDKINLTGYVLRSIDMEERSVVVVRGNETVTLSINFTSSEAASRRDSASKDALKKREERNAAELAEARRAIENRQDANPGTPPPPPDGKMGGDAPAATSSQRGRRGDAPGTPGSSGTTGGNPTIRQSMQERINRDREQREQRDQREQPVRQPAR